MDSKSDKIGNSFNLEKREFLNCSCFKISGKLLPNNIINFPMQDVLNYRVGTYDQFMHVMLYDLLSNKHEDLKNLVKGNERNDLSIGLLSGSAVILDILSFYQERIANEGFLRTCTERRSLMELGRLIGYELRPAISASTFLSFTVDKTPEAQIEKATIEPATKVMSVPSSNSELPQIFETIERFEARPEWNSLQITTTKQQILDEESILIYLNGLYTRLKEGDLLLVVENYSEKNNDIEDSDNLSQTNVDMQKKYLRIISRLELDSEKQQTLVSITRAPDFIVNEGVRNDNTDTSNMKSDFKNSPAMMMMTMATKRKTNNNNLIYTNIYNLDKKKSRKLVKKKWKPSEISFFAYKNNISVKAAQKILNALAVKEEIGSKPIIKTQPEPPQPEPPQPEPPQPEPPQPEPPQPEPSKSYDLLGVDVYAFRTKANIFGYNAPKFSTVKSSLNHDEENNWGTDGWDEFNKKEAKKPPMPINIKGLTEKGFPIYYDNISHNLFYLEGVYESILPNNKSEQSWIVIKSSSPFIDSSLEPEKDNIQFKSVALVSTIESTVENNVFNFGNSAKATGIYIDENDLNELENEKYNFNFRETTVFAQSERLDLTRIEIEEPLFGDTIGLSGEIEYLRLGQRIAISGLQVAEENVDLFIRKSEIVTIKDFELTGGNTTLVVEPTLKYRYRRDTVTINANIVRANHGQTKESILGSGDPSQSAQHFILKENPVTFTSSSDSPTGIESTIQVFVDDVKWDQTDNFFDIEPNEKFFTTKQDINMNTRIIFGGSVFNGKKRGSRLPAGIDNIKVKYRVGAGLDGLLLPDKLTILMDRPYGISSVTNPVESSGASSSESFNEGKYNIPFVVSTIDRIVSLEDYENFAISFSGIGKAQAVRILYKEKEVAYLTVLSETGTALDFQSELIENLKHSINQFKDPSSSFHIGSPQIRFFNIHASLMITKGFNFELVKTDVEEKLKDHFSFKNRDFGQPLNLGEVVYVIQSVLGVDAVDVNYLYVENEDPSLETFIQCRMPAWNNTFDKIDPAELLIINSLENGLGIVLSKMKEIK